MHADHLLGLPGLLRTMALQGREAPMSLFGPPGSERTIWDAVRLGVERVAFEVTVNELLPDEGLDRGDYEILPFSVAHGRTAVGYAIREKERLGRFDVDRARALGLPEGPLFGRLHRGESVEVDGRTILPEELVGPPRPGRLVVFSGDTAPTPRTIEVAAGADLLIHEATFADDEEERARETAHSTARQAAEVAKAAGVARLLLTHISARYSDDPSPLRDEAREVFAPTEVARDGLAIEIALPGDE
jgi:ribonuclease Z